VSGGWWALIGFGLAGVLSLAKDWMMLNRQTKLEWRKERQDELRAARVAALLVGEELEFHVREYRSLRAKGRTPPRPVEEIPDFLGSAAWDAHQESIARIMDIPNDTVRALYTVYHDTKELRSRIAIDGPDTEFPAHRISDLELSETQAQELAEDLFDAAARIAEELGPIGAKRRPLSRLWTDRGPSADEVSATPTPKTDADEKT
jgi:hypothetical protein